MESPCATIALFSLILVAGTVDARPNQESYVDHVGHKKFTNNFEPTPTATNYVEFTSQMAQVNDHFVGHKKFTNNFEPTPTATNYAEYTGQNAQANDFDSRSSVTAYAHDQKHVHDAHHPSSQHMHPIDPALLVFFTMEDLFVGKVMPIYFPRRKLSSLNFLPKQEADTIPFSLDQLPYLLHLFSISQGSPQAIAMEDTLGQCETRAIKGETKLCATSLQSRNGFIRGILGLDVDQLEVRTTTHITESNTLLQNYTILEILEDILAPKMVACHTMPYPYTIFYCHSQETKNRVLKVLLQGENGDKMEALSVCHMDTSQWSRNHASFGVLGIKPGTMPVCHFFPVDNFVWIRSTTSSSMSI